MAELDQLRKLSIFRDIDPAKFTEEQERIASSARQRTIEWLSLRQFGALDYTLAQRETVEEALANVKDALETGIPNNRYIQNISRFSICEAYGRDEGTQIVIRSTTQGGDLYCSLYKRTAVSPKEKLLQAMTNSKTNPFMEDPESLLEFWRLNPPFPAFDQIGEWVKRILELETKDSLVLRLLPTLVLERKNTYPYGARWATEEHNDLLIVTDPGRLSHINYLLRLIGQRDGGLIMARRANFNPANRPKNL